MPEFWTNRLRNRAGRDATRTISPTSGLPFCQSAYIEINHARMTHLASLNLPVEHKSVLDVGCGVGQLTQFFLDRECTVVCIDGRDSNVEAIRSLYPNVNAHVVNVDTDSLLKFGMFDVVFCYGLLYHLENPIGALRNMASVCRELLLLETVICDADLPVLRLEAERDDADQAVSGLGSRPSPSFVAMAIKHSGFPFLYVPRVPPNHECFRFKRKNNFESTRKGYRLRSIFIASRNPIESAQLFSFDEQPTFE